MFTKEFLLAINVRFKKDSSLLHLFTHLMEKTLIWCCTNKADSRDVKSGCFIHQGLSDTHLWTGEHSYLQAARLQPQRVKRHSGPPDFLQHGKNHFLPEQLMGGEDGGKVGEKHFRGNLSQEEGKTLFFLITAYLLNCTLGYFWFQICSCFCIFHCCFIFPVSHSRITQYVKQWKIELCSMQGWKKPRDWLFSTAGTVWLRPCRLTSGRNPLLWRLTSAAITSCKRQRHFRQTSCGKHLYHPAIRRSRLINQHQQKAHFSLIKLN